MSLPLGRVVAYSLLISCAANVTDNESSAWAPGAFAGAPAVTANGTPSVGGAADPATDVTSAGNASSPGATSASDGSGMATTLNLTGAPVYTRFVRLTKRQWARSVQAILSLPNATGLEQAFQDAVAGTTDFTNNELVLSVGQRMVSDFQDAAESLNLRTLRRARSLGPGQRTVAGRARLTQRPSVRRSFDAWAFDIAQTVRLTLSTV